MPAEIRRSLRNVLASEKRLHTIRTAVDALPPAARDLLGSALRFSAARLGDVMDFAEWITGRRDPLLPPRRMIFVGSNSIIKADYHAIGRELVDLARRLAGLRHDHVVLEIGSGTGRIAASLTNVLSSAGRYEGFEIVREGVEWCQTNITSRFPRFRFAHANIFNKFYNPHGTDSAATHRFPYGDATFDVVIATSVLTHMYRPDGAQYLAEIARVLKPGGRSFITHLLWTPESAQAVADGRCPMNFIFPVDDGFTVDAQRPEAAIAIDLAAVQADYQRAGLQMDPVYAGRWTGNADGLHFQDIVVARKL